MKKSFYSIFTAAAMFILSGAACAVDFSQLVRLKAKDIPFTAASAVDAQPALPALAPAACQRAVQPGTAILPVISDQGRVNGILELIRKIYTNAPLPFPPHDGSTFTNVEGVLPKQAPDFYKEYTFMPPPNSPSDITIGGQAYHVSPPIGKRGAERIIIGGGQLVYYTVDHYKTFIQLTIVQ